MAIHRKDAKKAKAVNTAIGSKISGRQQDAGAPRGGSN